MNKEKKSRILEVFNNNPAMNLMFIMEELSEYVDVTSDELKDAMWKVYIKIKNGEDDSEYHGEVTA